MKTGKVKNKAAFTKKTVFFTVVAGMLCFAVFTFAKLNYLNYVEQKNLDSQLETKRDLERTLRKLQKEKNDLHDLEYLKEYAREKLFLMEENEIPIRVITPDAREDSSTGHEPSGSTPVKR
ncbi:MAG: septum formation initiator family protein [bacterium]